MSCNDFSYFHYKHCLEVFQESGYTFHCCRDEKPKSKSIVLRHDVDSHLNNALRFAEIEYSLGITSTYFIRLHASYNPYFLPNYRMIHEINSMGHEIGLHFEPFFYKDNELTGLNYELCDMNLRFILSYSLSFTTHEPGKSNLAFKKDSNFLKFAKKDFDVIDGYKYISDSSGRWREGCMCNFVDKVEKLYINTHPTWWYEESPIENF